MIRASFSNNGALWSGEDFGLVGLNDVTIVEGASGPMLYAAGRGGSWLSAYDIGAGVGQTNLAQQWEIPSHLLQLETTDLVLRDSGGHQQLYMAGLNSADLIGVSLGGTPIGNLVSVSAPGYTLGTFTEMELINDGSQGLAALRSGGLVNVSFGTGNSLNVSSIQQGPALQGARASDIITAQHNGQTFALVSYGSADAVSLFRQGAGGMQHIADATAADGFWADRPGAVTMTSAADGQLYAVVASSGSDSLSTFQIQDGALVPTDHVIDSLGTRFADATQVTSVSVGDHNFVLAAGSDSGISLFTMLPGGRLQHVESMAGNMETPMRGITSMDAMATPDGLRLWVSTEAAPYLAEFSVALPNLGLNLSASAGGGALGGSVGDDILAGARGADQIAAGLGDDILLDGAGADTLRGDGGRDTFVLVEDGAKDVIQDFELGFDTLDLSDFSLTSGLGGLTISSRSWGAEIRVGDDVLDVRRAGGGSLRAEDFNATNLITGNRVQTDPALYPGGTGTPRPDPNPGGPATPAQLDPAMLISNWINEPTFTLSPRQGDFIGSADPDLILSGGQNDRLFGDHGNDTIRSGAGNDSVDGQGGNDSIDGGADDDLLKGSAGFDTLNGGGGRDTLLGDSFADLLNGGDENDTLIGGDGFDQIYGGNGDDHAWAGAAPDRIWGGAGNDWLSAGSNVGQSVDGVFGEAGNDTLFGNAGFDLLNGGDGDDWLDGGHQSDNLYGENGNDTLLGDLGFDRLFGGDGNDVLYGGQAGDGLFGQNGNDSLWGGTDDDRAYGGAGDDVIQGGTGNDTLYGDAGFDTIVGDEGDDLLHGGFNADEFVFTDNHGNDTISDFDALNGNEVIDLTNLSSMTRFSDVMGAATQVGQDVVIQTGGGNSIRLANVNLSDIDGDDFIF